MRLEDIVLSVVRALLGVPGPNLRGVCIARADGDRYRLRYFYNEVPSKDEVDDASASTTEVYADLNPEHYSRWSEEDVVVCPWPELTADARREELRIYMRKEDQPETGDNYRSLSTIVERLAEPRTIGGGTTGIL
jgi:hypothetical protein